MDDVNRGKGCNVHQRSWINGGWFHLTVQAGGLQLCIITLPVFGICEKNPGIVRHALDLVFTSRKMGPQIAFLLSDFWIWVLGTTTEDTFHEGSPY